MTAADIARALDGRKSGRGWTARCPAHEDRTPSLGITERDGRVLVRCYAGCPQSDVIAALRSRGLWPERERPEWTPEDRARWAAERREFERDLPAARYWHRAVVTLSEESLDWEKSRLFDSTDRPADLDAIRNITAMLGRLKALGDTALVAEYRWWCERHPCMAAAMVRWARQREELDAIAVSRFVGLPMSAAHAYLREVRG